MTIISDILALPELAAELARAATLPENNVDPALAGAFFNQSPPTDADLNAVRDWAAQNEATAKIAKNLGWNLE